MRYINGRVLGSHFFEEPVTGARYLDSLQNELIPNLITLHLGLEEPDQFQRYLLFQQYGIPAHCTLPVHAYLDEVFPNR